MRKATCSALDLHHTPRAVLNFGLSVHRGLWSLLFDRVSCMHQSWSHERFAQKTLRTYSGQPQLAPRSFCHHSFSVVFTFSLPSGAC